jgi:hypothetical protein
MPILLFWYFPYIIYCGVSDLILSTRRDRRRHLKESALAWTHDRYLPGVDR